MRVAGDVDGCGECVGTVRPAERVDIDRCAGNVLAAGDHRRNGSEQIAAVKGFRQRRRPPRDAPRGAAMIARGEDVPGAPIDVDTLGRPEWPDELDEIVYIDRYGNAMTGRRAQSVAASAMVVAGGERIKRATTFSDVPPGTPFWYENSAGLVEIAVNMGRAADRLGLEIGAPIATT